MRTRPAGWEVGVISVLHHGARVGPMIECLNMVSQLDRLSLVRDIGARTTLLIATEEV